jgi:hypothetical protein
MGHGFFFVLKKCKNGTKIKGKKNRNIPYCNRMTETKSDAIIAMIVNGHPNHFMSFLSRLTIQSF